MKRGLMLSMLVFGLGACTAHKSSFSPIAVTGVPVPGAAEGVIPEECGWVAVSEGKKESLGPLTLSSSVRQFDSSLFLCCPGKAANAPECTEATWVFNGGAQPVVQPADFR